VAKELRIPYMPRKLLSVVLLLSASALHAASIKLTWSESNNPAAQDPGTVNVYRRTANCPSSVKSVTWLKLATGVSASGPYVDNAANTLYPHCYYVTSVINGVESVPSNMTFVPAPPTAAAGAWQP